MIAIYRFATAPAAYRSMFYPPHGLDYIVVVPPSMRSLWDSFGVKHRAWGRDPETGDWVLAFGKQPRPAERSERETADLFEGAQR